MGYKFDRNYHEHFASIPDLLVSNEKRQNNTHMRGCKSSDERSDSFYGTQSYKAAEDLCKYGWTEYLDEIRKEMEDFDLITRTPEEYKRIPFNSVVGYAPNVPNAILGIPESMITASTIARKVKSISLFYSSPVNCGVDKKDILKAGLLALKIVNIVERTGVRVGIMAVPMDAQDSSECLVCSVMVKDWRQPLDLLKVAFPMAQPSMFRRIGFKWLETCEGMTTDGFSCGYGRPLSNDGWEKEKEYFVNQGIMRKEDAFISTRMCMDLKYDLKKVARAAGLDYIREFQEDKKGVA